MYAASFTMAWKIDHSLLLSQGFPLLMGGKQNNNFQKVNRTAPQAWYKTLLIKYTNCMGGTPQ